MFSFFAITSPNRTSYVRNSELFSEKPSFRFLSVIFFHQKTAKLFKNKWKILNLSKTQRTEIQSDQFFSVSVPPPLYSEAAGPDSLKGAKAPNCH